MATKINPGLYSSSTDEWETPKPLFDWLSEIYQFQTDVCATQQNAKCVNYYTKEIDGLKQPWRGVCWMNPPYGRGIGKWIEKAYNESRWGNATIVALLPARTDTRWFHDFIIKNPTAEIRFLPGRLKFGDSKNSAPFPSMIVVFQKVKLLSKYNEANNKRERLPGAEAAR